MSLIRIISDYLDSLPFSCQRLIIAYSGGLDSAVLLHLAAEYIQRHPQLELLAIHVNHGLQTQAKQWQQHCQQQADSLGLRFIAKSVQLEPQSRRSLEAQAREARYAVFAPYLDKNSLLLTAQHQDDQVETLLLALKRGSGLTGLAAMPELKPLAGGWHGRPLLDVSKQSLRVYAEQQEISWVEDPSNQCCDFDRNFLRQQILPKLSERWPQFASNAARSVSLLQQSLSLVEELAEDDAQGLVAADNSLDCEGLLQLSDARQANLIRYCFAQQAWQMPSLAQLQQILKQVQSKPDARPCLSLNSGEVRRYQQRLYLLKPVEQEQLTEQLWEWSTPKLALNHGACLSWCLGGNLLQPSAELKVSIKYRHQVGNPQLAVYGRSGSRKLKKLLQEANIAPWLREQIPLLYFGEELVAVGDCYIAKAWTVSPPALGVSIHWQPA